MIDSCKGLSKRQEKKLPKRYRSQSRARTARAAALGEKEGARLAAALEAITETTTSLWRLEPNLSQLEGE